MKSQIDTKEIDALNNRWYNDACGTALALEFMGERWSLLIMRELMLGPRRFSDLRASLSGISANILTMRLERLQTLGVLHRRQLAPPANVQVYELTEWGYQAEPILQAMGRWAVRSPLHDASLPLTPVSAMLSLRAMLRPRHRAPAMIVGCRFGRDVFTARLSEHDLQLERGEHNAADVEFDTDTTSFVQPVYGKKSMDDLEAEKLLTLAGSRAIAQAFVDCFELPTGRK